MLPFDGFFNRKKKTDQNKKGRFVTIEEVIETAKRMRERQEEFLRNNPRPKYQPGEAWKSYFKTGKHGRFGLIYGTDPNEWKQTKPPTPGKKLDLNKGKWKPQFTVDDVRILDWYHIEGNTEVLFVVKGIFEIRYDFKKRIDFRGEPVYFNRLSKEESIAFINLAIKHDIIPMPMEELI